ncbi:MAG: 3-deoxy-D-manno-octulosonic acid transferase [Prevotella sp.]|nr:3-deoxy-D-manno-octulosonic acid transferase [Prevotella sp.]
MYNLIIYLYLLGVALVSRFNDKVRKMWRGERDAFGVLREKVEPGARYVWFHAASLGEFEQGRPLMEQLRRERPELKILLTFFSPSGYEVRKNYDGADIICYLPLDTIRNARKFLRLIRPEMAFFIKYEFWYNYLHILKHRGVPVYSVSSIFRDGQVFFRWYGRQYGRVLRCFTHFYVQNEKSRQLLATIGLTNVTITGDTRFDRVLQIKEQAKELPIVDAFLSSHSSPLTPHPSKVFVAGSSWPPDEEIFIRYFKEHPEWKLIIAPHVIGEDHLQQIEKQLEGFEVKRYSRGAGGDVLIIDCFGLLSSIYRYATVTYVGGGFGVGIHNTVEAAVWGVPVIFGPNNEKFQEAQELKTCGGGFEIKSYEDFASLMDRFASDSQFTASAGHAAGQYVEQKAGATRKILSDTITRL